MDARTELGRSGENAAAAFYRRRGFEVVARNRRVGRGEFDLIVRRGNLLVFCEVKTRRSDRWGLPSEAVNHAKRARMRRLAGTWLERERPGPVRVRFDVVSVIVRHDGLRIDHLPSAF